MITKITISFKRPQTIFGLNGKAHKVFCYEAENIESFFLDKYMVEIDNGYSSISFKLKNVASVVIKRHEQIIGLNLNTDEMLKDIKLGVKEKKNDGLRIKED